MSPAIEERLTAVEARVDQEAALRARMDTDQSDFGATMRATKDLVQELGLTQNQQTRMLMEHGKSLDEHSRKLDEHSRKLDEHSEMHAEHRREFVEVHAKLDLLIDLVRERRKRLW